MVKRIKAATKTRRETRFQLDKEARIVESTAIMAAADWKSAEYAAAKSAKDAEVRTDPRHPQNAGHMDPCARSKGPGVTHPRFAGQ